MADHRAARSLSRRGERGFTLIELLVVVTIIGILAAIVSVSVAGFTGTAQRNANAAKFNSVQVAVDVFNASTNDGSYPLEAARECNTVTAVGKINTGSTVLYDGKGDAFTCTNVTVVVVVNIWGTNGLVEKGFLRPQGITGNATLAPGGNNFQCILEGTSITLGASGYPKGKLVACSNNLFIY